MGSSAFLVVTFILTIATNMAFIVVCMLLYLFGMAEALFFDCTGFWVVLFSLITIECMQAPDMPRRMMFIPVDIPSKYFPLILYGIFCLFSGPLLSYAIAMGVGYIYSQGYLDKLRPTSYYLEGLESSGGTLHYVSRSGGWILAGATGHDAWIALNSAPAGGQGATWGQQAGQQQGQPRSGAPAGMGGFGNWAAQDSSPQGQGAASGPSGSAVGPDHGKSSAVSTYI